jgi:hypothetical protein
LNVEGDGIAVPNEQERHSEETVRASQAAIPRQSGGDSVHAHWNVDFERTSNRHSRCNGEGWTGHDANYSDRNRLPARQAGSGNHEMTTSDQRRTDERERDRLR